MSAKRLIITDNDGDRLVVEYPDEDTAVVYTLVEGKELDPDENDGRAVAMITAPQARRLIKFLQTEMELGDDNPDGVEIVTL